MNVELIVDSTVDVPEHIRSRLTVVPLTIHFGQEEYLDGVTMDKHRFYERLVESDVLPTTSQASPAAFDREFRRVRCSGGSAVVLTIAAGLSGTYQSACIAAAEYDNIYVVDSGTAAIGAASWRSTPWPAWTGAWTPPGWLGPWSRSGRTCASWPWWTPWST